MKAEFYDYTNYTEKKIENRPEWVVWKYSSADDAPEKYRELAAVLDATQPDTAFGESCATRIEGFGWKSDMGRMPDGTYLLRYYIIPHLKFDGNGWVY